MNNFNLDNKRFELSENSENGAVNAETVFLFKQQADLVTATYYGGTIKYGNILAIMNGDKLDLLYQCLTNNNELKAGKAKARITLNENEKMQLSLDWEWLTGGNIKGNSEYIEVET